MRLHSYLLFNQYERIMYCAAFIFIVYGASTTGFDACVGCFVLRLMSLQHSRTQVCSFSRF
jgi:hypothetical protein